MAFKHGLGIQVDRPAENIAITVTPGLPMFTVAGGLVLVRGLIGVCTTTFGGAANNLSFELNPTEASGANTALTAVTDIGTATVLGDVVVVVGAPGTGPLGGHVELNVMGLTQGMGIVVNSGVIGLVATAAAGAMRWILWYIPIDAGATVVIA